MQSAVASPFDSGGFRADSGPSLGGPSPRAIRPIEASKAAVCYVRNTSGPAVRCAQIAVSYRSQQIANLYFVKNLTIIDVVAVGFSSMIQWPELGTIPPFTSLATNPSSLAMSAP